MKKKILAFVLVTVLVLSFSSVAFAAVLTPIKITTAITPASTLSDPIIVTQGQTITLTSTTTVKTGNGEFVSENWTNAAVIQPASGGPAHVFRSTAAFSAADLTPGPYTVTYSITLKRGTSDNTTSDVNTAYLQVIGQTQTTNVKPMAAPAIAAKILSFNNVKPGYKSGKTKGNYISDVTHHMGPKTDFNGVPKSIKVNGKQVSNPAYRLAVLAYLNGLVNPKIFTMPDASYFMK